MTRELLPAALAFAAGYFVARRRRPAAGAAREVWTTLRAAQVGEYLSYALYQLREYLISVTTAVESLALAVPRDEPEVAERLDRLKRVMGELNAKAGRLLGDASPVTSLPAPAGATFALGPLVRETVLQARAAFSEDGVPVKLVEEDSPEMSADPRALKLCLLAVLQNALEACERRKGGSVSVVCRRKEPDAEIEVIDDGGGIPAAIEQILFEPFFSARPQGGGLGLGLAMSRRMIERQGGTLRVKSKENYTAVVLALPISRKLPVVRNEESTWAGRRDSV